MRRRRRQVALVLVVVVRLVVVLRLLDDRTTRETAEILQVPEGTVLSRLSRAVQQLRVTLGPVWEEFSE